MRIFSFIIILLLSTILSQTVVHGTPKELSSAKERLPAIDRYLDQAIPALGAPGGSVALVYQGEQVYSRSWGITGGSKDKVTEETPFLIGSISKTLTAYAIMRLVDEGVIQLDTPVQQIIPWFTLPDAEAASQMTIRHLLSQTSGMSNQAGMDIADQGASDLLAIQRNAKALTTVQNEAFPGERHIYSNANYALLGAIIEEVSGMTYAAYMESNVFTPLGMEHTAATVQKAEAWGWQPGYRSWLGLSFPSDIPYDNGGAPYGYLAASSSDMARFLIALQKPGEVVSVQKTSDMMQPAVWVRPGSAYGLGLRITQIESGESRIWHAGSTPDFRSEILLLPDSGWGIVMLTNQNNRLEEERVSRIVKGMQDLLLTGKTQPVTFPLIWERWLAVAVIVGLMGYTAWILASFWHGWGMQYSKSVWGLIGGVYFLAAALLIPGLLYATKVSWHTISLYVPDLTELTLLAVILLAMNGILSLIKSSNA